MSAVFLRIISTLWAAHLQSQFMDEIQQGEMFYLKPYNFALGQEFNILEPYFFLSC